MNHEKPRCNEKKNSKQDSCAIWLQVRYTQFKVESLAQKKQKKIPNWPTSLPQSDKLLVCDMLATVQFEAFHHTRNPTIYNIIRWFAGPMGQTTCQPSI